ncbi:unnamed protein product [Allacma fusca]|uniref:Uncharacterized protein n=1 Tax=Allacma fusca TaxID=39272 RepID=A0A8J2LSK2_9HEXA|nr:unnamed protein product [Allacma fusca]
MKEQYCGWDYYCFSASCTKVKDSLTQGGQRHVINIDTKTSHTDKSHNFSPYRMRIERFDTLRNPYQLIGLLSVSFGNQNWLLCRLQNLLVFPEKNLKDLSVVMAGVHT